MTDLRIIAVLAVFGVGVTVTVTPAWAANKPAGAGSVGGPASGKTTIGGPAKTKSAIGGPAANIGGAKSGASGHHKH